MKLCFMTFVCPGWEIERAVKFAREADYDGVEIRVDAGHRHNISTQSSAETRRYVRKLFGDHGIEIACVATSVQFGYPNPAEHRKNVETAKANLNLAADLGAPLVRIFAGGGMPALTSAAAKQVAAAFDEVGDYAMASGVRPMLECGHDIIKGAAEADEVVKKIRTQNFGALWNYSEMDGKTYDVLKDRISHFHVHDEVLDPGNMNILVLAKQMKGVGYRGYVSLEVYFKEENVPENLLKETSSRLKRYIAQA